MKDLRKELENIFASIAFAEEGEHEKAREILKGRKKVLLAMSESMPDANVLRYALNISERIEADLDILYLARSSEKNTELEEFLWEIGRRGLLCSVVKRQGCMKKAILDYTEKRSDILFVIVGTESELEIECEVDGKTFSRAWKRLKCPLVVVSRGEMPSTA